MMVRTLLFAGFISQIEVTVAVEVNERLKLLSK